MKITSLKLTNVRGFQSLPKFDLSPTINVFIGRNNAGKSTILNSIFTLQRRIFGRSDITIGQSNGSIELFYDEAYKNYFRKFNSNTSVIFNLLNQSFEYNTSAGLGPLPNQTPESEPTNLIYPYLSKRKTINYTHHINESNANSVNGNFEYLYSKIDRLVTPQFKPGHLQYVKACENILGFEISALAKGDGKQAVYFVHNLEHIPLTAMGEGVANILGLIVDLCVAENKIFLIEEPENDIHPKALKALLKLIIEKSSTNQFFISTHSNIVMKYLGSEPATKIFHVTNTERDTQKTNLFISKVTEVSKDSEERRQILEDMGYDFFDFDLWKGWLFLEESSAEFIIRDHLVRWFVKPLQTNLRTFSASSKSQIESKFEDFDRLFIFLHLEPTYKNRVWVMIDSGDEERSIIDRMRDKYVKSGWDSNNFSQFNKHDFELYYPEEFQEKIESVLKIADKKKKMHAKKDLLEEVKKWIHEDDERAKNAFKVSAAEIIDVLKEISKKLQ